MRLIAFLAGLMLAAPVAAQTAQPAVLADACSTCHGVDLEGSGAMPPLRDQSTDDIRKALTEFRAGQRAATVMTRLMKGFSDAEIEAVAGHIGAMK